MRALGQREGCTPAGLGHAQGHRPGTVLPASPSSLPLWGQCIGGQSEVGCPRRLCRLPSRGPRVSPVRQVSQHDPPNQYPRHEDRLGHLFQSSGVTHQVPLRRRKVVPAWLGPDRPSQPSSAGAPRCRPAPGVLTRLP